MALNIHGPLFFMQKNNIRLPLEIYSEHLETIRGVNFTHREIDIIACILSGRSAKTIPSFLSISSKTVSTHIAKIRAKIGCSSRESIIDFVEKSDKLHLIKNEYYLSLLVQEIFEKQLRKISKGSFSEVPLCHLVYTPTQKNEGSLIHYLESHLKFVGFKTESQIKEEHNIFADFPQEIASSDYILYVMPKELDESFHMGKTIKISNNVVFLCPYKEGHEPNSEKLDITQCIDFSSSSNYYLSFFKLLKKLFPNKHIDKLDEEFKEHWKRICDSTERTPLQIQHNVPLQELGRRPWTKLFFSLLEKEKNKIIAASILLLLSICISFIFIGNKDEIIKNNSALRSDLILPTNSVFLDRPELTQDINTKLINQKGIQTIALVGPGGSGKTTLARQYAHQQKENVIWEINAETHESLRASFENLAQALSQTEEDKKELRGLLEIKDPTKREENILQFVKKHLSSTPNWVLIYDNVENFLNIQDYFPWDNVTWGEGKVILTTRDSNIQNNA
ncbi:MAG: Tetratricopeptide repeat protein, partial [uncultured bacterium]